MQSEASACHWKQNPPSAVRHHVQWCPEDYQIFQYITLYCESDERKSLISLEGVWAILHHFASQILLDRERLSKVDFYDVILNSFWWKQRDKYVKYRCIRGKVGEDVTVALIYGHIQIHPPLKYHVGSDSKKKKVWTEVSVSSLFQRQESINVLEITLSSANSNVVNQTE